MRNILHSVAKNVFSINEFRKLVSSLSLSREFTSGFHARITLKIAILKTMRPLAIDLLNVIVSEGVILGLRLCSHRRICCSSNGGWKITQGGWGLLDESLMRFLLVVKIMETCEMSTKISTSIFL